ncbi:YdcH family protein [Microbulbifer sp. 2201CG32-9]|uniref:YdcH family protein n=1 Tax=unclassified Microbulbifer TaxID=2619833 RepID=UPI00345BAAA8
MSIAPHTLEKDFPAYRATIKRLIQEDFQFRSESATYNKLDKQIRGLEQRGVGTDDNHFNTLKIQRARMKDQLYRRITDSADGHELTGNRTDL